MHGPIPKSRETAGAESATHFGAHEVRILAVRKIRTHSSTGATLVVVLLSVDGAYPCGLAL